MQATPTVGCCKWIILHANSTFAVLNLYLLTDSKVHNSRNQRSLSLNQKTLQGLAPRYSLFVSVDALLVYTFSHQNVVVLVVGLWNTSIECSLGHHHLMP